ncbi:sulfatase-like hydrolase/transferase, partial [Candidatus Latescibacterota bacterium]
AAITDNPEAWQSRALNYHNPEWVTSAALDFIDQNQDEPFFLYINQTLHHIPHPQESIFNGDPRMTHEGYLDQVPDCMPPREEIVAKVKAAGFSEHTAYCTWLDEALGAVMRKLGEHGISDDTLFIYLSDNNVPAKTTLYEGGVRVPMVIRYPRAVPGGRVSESLAQNLDFAPTMFSAAGITPPGDMHLDGADLMPLLAGDSEKIHEELFFESGWSRAVCTERWKYLALRFSEAAEKRRLAKGGQFPWVYHTGALEPHQHHVMLWRPAFFEPDQLYDMHVDSDEIVNLSNKHKYAGILSDMKGRIGNWLRTFDHPYAEFAG